MFENEDLKNHLETSSTIRLKSLVVAEWNMNIPTNIKKIGNYRYRPTEADGTKYKLPNASFDNSDLGNYYTGATDADVVIDGGFQDNNQPQLFTPKKEKFQMLYSLEECFGRFRPRSGINKLAYFEDRKIHHSNINMAKRPRYYISDKNDKFKYWTSYRTEEGKAKGISYASENIAGQYFIDDAAPFIVYKEKVPTNRLIVKMQTHIGSIDLGPFNKKTGSFDDPFYSDSNKRTPANWKIQILKNNNWIDAASFKSTDTRRDGTQIIKNDGYVELSYGLIVPDQYRDIFVKAEEYTSTSFLPEKSVNGYAYLIKQNDADIGEYHIWIDTEYKIIKPVYGWYLEEETVERLTNFVTNLTSPDSYTEESSKTIKYTEFEYIEGIRVVVETMTKNNSTFDLIEISPRLAVDLSDKTSSFDISKIGSDLGVSGMPVGQLLASNGSLVLCDYDQSFNENNSNSIISKFLTRHIQFKFYEVIVDVSGYDYYVPIKTMYADGFPETNFSNRDVTIQLRDLFFYFESIVAPEMLIPNVSLSYAVSLLLDSIGFANYDYSRVEGETELIIPYFFIAPDKSVAQVLNDLAISSQTAMFFDEYNNFIMMSKNYIMPLETQRETDMVLYGTKDFIKDGAIENKTNKDNLANIIDISSKNNLVYNSGKISYQTKYIQKSVGSLRQASRLDKERVWIYKPSLLWEVSGESNTKAVNDEVGNQSSYVLSAIPLTSDLSDAVPTVVNNSIINNIMDLGEAVYWLSRYNGYFYANAEIIKFDAVEYNIPKMGIGLSTEVNGQFVELQSNNVWITNVQEYQNYFSKLGFNGKIYPTGRVRIYTEPNYEEINGVLKLKNGAVAKHGRGQFGTKVAYHSAGLNPYWSNNSYIRGCNMQSKYLFDINPSNTLSNVSSTVFRLTGVSSSTITLTVSSSANISVGQEVFVVSGTGQLQSGTRVVAKPNATSVAINKIPTVALNNATVDFKTVVQNVTVSNQTLVMSSNAKLSIGQELSIESGSGLLSTTQKTKIVAKPGPTTITISPAPIVPLNNSTVKFTTSLPNTQIGLSGPNNTLAQKTTRNGIIKNFLSSTYINESELLRYDTAKTGSVQSSALVMSGPSFATAEKPLDFISYVYKPLDNKFKHFGTRMRVIGRVESNENKTQTPIGSLTYYSVPGRSPNENITIGGGSGGLAVMVNPETNNGYYFELIALTDSNIESYTDEAPIYNMVFYKIKRSSETSSEYGVNIGDAIPIKLWSGLGKIVVDDGKFTGQYRMISEETPTVYDVGVEYEDIGNVRKFYLYINNKLVGTTIDTEPLPVYNNMGLFVRGSSRVMFENIFAIGNNYSKTSNFKVDIPVNMSFGDDSITATESFRKYAMSGIVQSTFLSGVSPKDIPQHNLYFDEFGTIMREASYFNVKYDKAYPALYAKISPTFNRMKGYTISGFRAGSYGAEFLIFNATDTVLSLDETTGNYLRIQGITFTQQSQNELSVDDYFSKNSNFANPNIQANSTVVSPFRVLEEYQDIKTSRMTHGIKEFTLDAPYIQTQDAATNLMSWMTSKIMKPRKSVGLKIFYNPTLQLGDIVSIDYKDNESINTIDDISKRFVVYQIDYARSLEDMSMTVYLSEVA